jgi:hypothetical protein
MLRNSNCVLQVELDKRAILARVPCAVDLTGILEWNSEVFDSAATSPVKSLQTKNLVYAHAPTDYGIAGLWTIYLSVKHIGHSS